MIETREYQWRKKKKIKLCVICKKEFNKFHNQKTCSFECREKLRKNYLQTWYQKNKERIKEQHQIWLNRNQEKIKNYYKVNIEFKRKQSILNAKKIRLEVLKIIGNGNLVCVKCGCNKIELLQINHLNGNGKEDYKNGHKFYRNIIKGKRKIDDLNILCQACNFIDFLNRKYSLNFNLEPFRQQ